MYYNMSIVDQIQNVIEKNDYLFNIRTSQTQFDNIDDVYDGEIYQNLLQTDDGDLLKSGKAFTFILNTDGISVSDRSNLSIWPIYLAINEIPIANRYSIENIIIGGNKNLILYNY